MTKQELTQLVLTEEELKNIDYALPQDWVNELMENRIDPRPYFVWDYNENKYGQPLNLAERFVEKFNNLPKAIGNANLDKERIGAMYATLSLVNEALNL